MLIFDTNKLKIENRVENSPHVLLKNDKNQVIMSLQRMITLLIILRLHCQEQHHPMKKDKIQKPLPQQNRQAQQKKLQKDQLGLLKNLNQ